MSPIPRIGYLVPQFPGQTHIFFWREIAALEALGAHVALLSTRKPPAGLIAHEWSDQAIARTTYLGVPDVIAGLRGLMRLDWRALLQAIKAGGMPVAKDIAISIPAARRLADYAKRERLDHVHVHSCGRAALIAALAEQMTGLPYSVTLHGPMSDYGPGQPLKWRNARFATIITRKLLAEAQDELGHDLPDNIIIRPMGVDTETLKPAAPYDPFVPGTPEPLTLFSCARLNIVKGHQDLMQAVKILRDRGLNVRLEIAGEDDAGGGGFHTELDRTIADLDLQGSVHLLGAIDADAVKSKLLASHIFVLASWHEPLGVAYMEAMSCGIPTIGTRSGGVPELIESGVNGILVPPKSPQDLADAISELASTPERARSLSVNGRQHIVDHFRAALGAEVILKHIQAD